MNKAEIKEAENGLTQLFFEVAGGTPKVVFHHKGKAGPVLTATFAPGEIAAAIRCQRAVAGWGDKVLEPALATQQSPAFTFQMIRKTNT